MNIETELNLNEIVKIEQMPKVFEQLELIGSYVDEQLKDLDKLECTDKNKQEVKDKRTVINNTLREIQWGGVENPKTYTMSDADLLLDSPELFARKFDSDVDCEIIDWVYCKIK